MRGISSIAKLVIRRSFSARTSARLRMRGEEADDQRARLQARNHGGVGRLDREQEVGGRENGVRAVGESWRP